MPSLVVHYLKFNLFLINITFEDDNEAVWGPPPALGALHTVCCAGSEAVALIIVIVINGKY